MATPMYLLVEPMFANGGPQGPEIIPKGTIIRTNATPGMHLKPLNEEATVRMEEWYQEVVTFMETVFDDAGIPSLKTRRIQPHLKYKMAAGVEAVETHAIHVVRGPSKDQPGSLSLTETLYGLGSKDQRPAPAMEYSPDLSEIEPELEVAAAAKENPFKKRAS